MCQELVKKIKNSLIQLALKFKLIFQLTQINKKKNPISDISNPSLAKQRTTIQIITYTFFELLIRLESNSF